MPVFTRNDTFKKTEAEVIESLQDRPRCERLRHFTDAGAAGLSSDASLNGRTGRSCEHPHKIYKKVRSVTKGARR